MRSNVDRRTRSVRQMTGTSFKANGQGGRSRHIASGQIFVDDDDENGLGGGGGTSRMTITRRHGEPQHEPSNSRPHSSSLSAFLSPGRSRLEITRRYGEPQNSQSQLSASSLSAISSEGDIEDFKTTEDELYNENNGSSNDNDNDGGTTSEESSNIHHIGEVGIAGTSSRTISRLSSNRSNRNSYNTTDQIESDYGGIEEEAIMFPQSTHSWLFTQNICSQAFWFAVGIVVLSYFCLALAIVNIFEDYQEDNPLNVPFNVLASVRMAQYLAIFIALIMEEEIPTALYQLRMISKECLHKKFPKIKFWKFVAAAIIRLIMGYLFLFNTFVVVAQATAVLDIFYDVLALQFLQQLDDIAFNLAKIDVFGRSLKHAALSRCFQAEFEKKKFGLRKKMNKYLKAIYFVNFLLLLSGMAWITRAQQIGGFHADSIMVTFGDQVWNDAIVKTAEGGLETRVLLFSYFNGVYEKSDNTHDGRPVYVERNKFDGTSFLNTVPAEIKYCEGEEAWVFAHQDIRKSKDQDEVECPWLLRSPETKEFDLLGVAGDWSIWTGSLEQNGHVTVLDNKCQGEVSCNYHGTCGDDGKCQCDKDGGFYGIHCEHKKPCSLITGGKGGSWSKVTYPSQESLIYQRSFYMYEQGIPDALLEEKGINKIEDQMFLFYTGSRWLGTVYPGFKRNRMSRQAFTNYVSDFHAFWENTYSTMTEFASDPTTQSSIIGIDFYMVGEQGEQFGPYGQLFPLSEPEGSGFMRCAEGEFEVYSWDAIYVDHNVDFSDDSVGTIAINYFIGKDREYESNLLGKDCSDPITDISYKVTYDRLLAYETHDILRTSFSLDKSQLKGSENWNATSGMIEFCHVLRLVVPATEFTPKEVLVEEFHLISETV